MELAIALNSRFSNKMEMQYLAQEVLRMYDWTLNLA